jgi:hypothetical protein
MSVSCVRNLNWRLGLRRSLVNVSVDLGGGLALFRMSQFEFKC